MDDVQVMNAFADALIVRRRGRAMNGRPHSRVGPFHRAEQLIDHALQFHHAATQQVDERRSASERRDGSAANKNPIPAVKSDRYKPSQRSIADFGVIASATSLLELRGHDEPALNALATLAAAFETATGAMIEIDRRRASEPLRHGATGTTMRIAGFFSGPVPLLLRLLRKRKAAAASAILGSLITRIAWVEAGRVSARDPHAAMES